MKESTKEKFNKFCDIGLIILTCFALLFAGFCLGCKIQELVDKKDDDVSLKSDVKLARETGFVSTRLDLNYRRNFLRDEVSSLEYAFDNDLLDITEFDFRASDFNLDYFFKADYIYLNEIQYEFLPVNEFTFYYGGNFEYYFRYYYVNGLIREYVNVPLFSFQNGDVIEQSSLSLDRFKYIYDFNDFVMIDISVENFNLKLSYVQFLKIFFNVQDVDNVYLGDGFNPINYITRSDRNNGFLDNSSGVYNVVDINQNHNIIFTDGLFRVGDTFYNNITFVCASGTGYYAYLNGSYVKLEYNIIVPIYVKFDNTQVLTISNKTIQVQNQNPVNINEFNVYTWTNEIFRNIKVYSYGNAVNSLLIGNFTNQETLSITYNTTRHYIDGGQGNIGGAFSLIGTAFSVFTPFFSMSIVPGITVGLMLTIPLIVVVLIVIFRLVRK